MEGPSSSRNISVIGTKDLYSYPKTRRPTFELPSEEDEKHRIRNDSTTSILSGLRGSDSSPCLIKFLITVTILTSLIAISAFSIAIFLWHRSDVIGRNLASAHAPAVSAQNEARFCIPCKELVQGPFEDDNIILETLEKREANGTSVCCAKTSEQTSTIFNLFVSRKQKQQQAKAEINRNECKCTEPQNTQLSETSSQVSAHLMLGQTSGIIRRSVDSTIDSPVRSWNHYQSPCHLSGIKLSDGKLLVPENGVYFVYSQVSFLVYYDTTSGQSTSGRSLHHFLFRYNLLYPNGGNEELLRRVTSQYKSQTSEYGTYSSYLGANFNLVKGDEIYIKVSHVSQLLRDPEMTYFGLFKIN